MLHRYTWYSNDGKTRKILDYVLVETYVQQYVTDCRVKRGFDFDTDHRLLKTSLCTPSTRKARRKCNAKPQKLKVNIKALMDPAVTKKFVDTVSKELRTSDNHPESPCGMSEKVIESLNLAASRVIPPKPRTEKDNELWKNDDLLNELLEQRTKTPQNSPDYKVVMRKVKTSLRS